MRLRRALSLIFVACTAAPAFAHGGNYTPPPPPPPRRNVGPSDPGADPVTTPPDEVVRGATTRDDWSRWWDFHAPRFLGEGAEPPAALPEALRTRVIAALRKLAGDVSEDIATASLIALGRDGDPSHLPVLLPILQDARRTGPVRESAALAVGLLRGPLEAPALDALQSLASDPSGPPRLRSFAAAALGLRAAGRAVLLRLAHDPTEPIDVQCTAASALGLLGGDDARNLLVKIAHEKPRGGEGSVVRVYACQGLARCGGPDAVTALRTLAGDSEPGVRRATALALAEAADSKDDVVQRTLLELAARDPEPEVRAAALLALGRQGHAKSRATLEAAWRRNDDLRKFAALGLGLLARRRGDPEFATVLRGVPDGKEPLEIRGVALVALGLARDTTVLETAFHIASGSADATLQCRAADCLALLGDRERGAEGLRRLLVNAKDPILQRHAAVALGRLGGASAGDDLVRTLRSQAGLFVRADVAVTLGRIGGAGPAKELVALLEDEKQPGLLRAMAAVGLGISLDRSGGRRLARLGEDLDWARLTPATEELLSIL